MSAGARAIDSTEQAKGQGPAVRRARGSVEENSTIVEVFQGDVLNSQTLQYSDNNVHMTT